MDNNKFAFRFIVSGAAPAEQVAASAAVETELMQVAAAIHAIGLENVTRTLLQAAGR